MKAIFQTDRLWVTRVMLNQLAIIIIMDLTLRGIVKVEILRDKKYDFQYSKNSYIMQLTKFWMMPFHTVDIHLISEILRFRSGQSLFFFT